MNHIRTLAALLLSVSLGAAVWGLSPHIIGSLEAWDGPHWYYPIALFVAGFLPALLSHSQPALNLGAVALGQVVYVCIYLPGGPLWIIGFFLGCFSLLFVVFGIRTAIVLIRLSSTSKRLGNSTA